MRTIKERLTNEIEYLKALAEMYEQESDRNARQKSLAAIEALNQLIAVIDEAPIISPESVLQAA